MADRGLHESRAGGRCGGWAARSGVTHEERERQHPDSHEDHDDVQDLVTQLHASPGAWIKGSRPLPRPLCAFCWSWRVYRGTRCRRDRLSAKRDRKSTRLNSSHGYISYAVFCLKKKKKAAVMARRGAYNA